MKLARRIESMPPYVFAKAGAKIASMRKKGVDVIDLGIGSPDLAPPKDIIDTMYESALQPDTHGYAGYYGTPAFRKGVATYYGRRFGVELDPENEVVSLIGSKEGIANVNLAFVDPGDTVIVSDPGYPTYTQGAMLVGGQIYYVPLLPERNYEVDLASIPPEVAEKAKMIWINYPNNPTGAVANLDFLSCCVTFAREFGVLLCYDNPYCDLTFDGYVAPSILQAPGAMDVAIEFNSLSKTYNMAGWRVGMAVGNRTAVEALARVKTNIDSGIFRPLQAAATFALNGDQGWLAERNMIYQRRRDVVMRALPRTGMTAETPKAGLYVWAKAPKGYTSASYSDRALDEKGVWITPGPTFGARGEGYVRISLCIGEERLREAMERLATL
jgi:LL-diaminopimelate aminotransferase